MQDLIDDRRTQLVRSFVTHPLVDPARQNHGELNDSTVFEVKKALPLLRLPLGSFSQVNEFHPRRPQYRFPDMIESESGMSVCCQEMMKGRGTVMPPVHGCVEAVCQNFECLR